MYKRILAIGDIHGEYDKLLDLLAKIDFNPPDDLLVFLGDYLDRGEQPLHVMGWMLKRRDNPRIVMLRGNHDQMMLDHYLGKEAQKALGWHVDAEDYGDIWLDAGGDATKSALDELARFAPRLESRLRARWLSLVGNMPLSFQVEAGGRRFFFCHAGIDPDAPPAAQEPRDLLWGDVPEDYAGEATIVAGHVPVHYKPLVTPKRIMVDTGACCHHREAEPDKPVYLHFGKLSCVDVLSGQFWQSSRWPCNPAGRG